MLVNREMVEPQHFTLIHRAKPLLDNVDNKISATQNDCHNSDNNVSVILLFICDFYSRMHSAYMNSFINKYEFYSHWIVNDFILFFYYLSTYIWAWLGPRARAYVWVHWFCMRTVYTNVCFFRILFVFSA